MLDQQAERYEILQVIADIIGAILAFFKPWVTPIGAWLVSWIDVLLGFFPADNLTIYFVIFGVLVISGIIVNTKWPGVKYIEVYKKDGVDDTSIEHLDADDEEPITEEEKTEKTKKAHKLFKKDED